MTRKTLLIALAALASTTAVAKETGESECTFTDIISWESRACEAGPSDSSWEYLQTDKLGEITIDPTWQDELGWLHDLTEDKDQTVGSDPEYDAPSSSESDSLSKAVQALLDFLRILVALGAGYEDLIDQLGLTGHYDGSLSNGSTSADAFLDLDHSAGRVEGTLFVQESSLVLDGGICGSVTLPISAVRVNATSSSSFSATGTTRRAVSVGPFSGTVDVTFDLTLDPVGHEILVGTLDLDLPFPCSDSTVTGRFDRRLEQLF